MFEHSFIYFFVLIIMTLVASEDASTIGLTRISTARWCRYPYNRAWELHASSLLTMGSATAASSVIQTDMTQFWAKWERLWTCWVVFYDVC